ncbi:MAG: hypothetical protein KC657_39820 [Myxococcales bacterium]|nr:hypothetical protein [Myxococcales bacterium]
MSKTNSRVPECPKGVRHRWAPTQTGCRENPGVWSVGGTTLVFSHTCQRCGCRRVETRYGSQRNPGQRDGVEYIEPVRDEDAA